MRTELKFQNRHFVYQNNIIPKVKLTYKISNIYTKGKEISLLYSTAVQSQSESLKLKKTSRVKFIGS